MMFCVSKAAISARPHEVCHAIRPVSKPTRVQSASDLTLRFGLLILTLSLFSGCGSGALAKSPDGASQAKARPPVPVRIQASVSKSIARRIVVLGSVRPVRTSVVASGNAGIVEEFLVKEGQFVKAGDTLSILRMATTDLEIAENRAMLKEREALLNEMKSGYRRQDIEEAAAKLLAAEAARKSSAAKLLRVQGLKQRGAATQEELDDAEERATASQNLHEAQQKLVEKLREGYRDTEIAAAQARFEAQQKHVDFLEAEKEKRTTKAPFRGYIVKEHTHAGQFLSLGSPIATLTELDVVDAVVPVDEQDIGIIKIGQEATVQFQSLPGQEFQGKVEFIVPQSEWEQGSRAFPVKVRLKNVFQVQGEDKGFPLFKEGMTAQVTFKGPPLTGTLVPKDAVVRGATGSLVYLFMPKDDSGVGQVQPQPIVEGISEDSWIQDASGAVKAGASVVVEGAERLRPFQDVQILK